MFKKLTVLGIFALLVLGGSAAKADVFYFKDGRVLKVQRYTEKDGQLLFTLEKNGQLYSVEKDLIKKITRTHSSSRKPSDR